MREILFRGKRTDSGEWVEGYLSKSRDENKQLKLCIDHEEQGVMCSSIVYPETIGQYTGLTDKNGKKIFEGDIISIPFEEDVVYYENAEVYFDTEHYGWYVRYFDDDSFRLLVYNDGDITVIGNIHDNPRTAERR